MDGFQLDRGFQIFLTGYPTAQEELDFDALDLKPFYSGAMVRFQGALHRCGSSHPMLLALALPRMLLPHLVLARLSQSTTQPYLRS